MLDPVERLSEILFGLIMALTFTGSIHAANPEDEIRAVLIGAIGCNIAWGIVDAVMYLMTAMVARSRAALGIRKLRNASGADEARRILSQGGLPDEIADAMTPREFEGLHAWLAKLPEPKNTLPPGAMKGALAVFLLVTLSTFPVVVPFLVADDAVRALRFSHAIALTMLFVIGWMLGKHSGMRPWRTGFSMLAVGVLLAAVAIALGG